MKLQLALDVFNLEDALSLTCRSEIILILLKLERLLLWKAG